MTSHKFNSSTLTDIFYLNKKLPVYKFDAPKIQTTYDTNFKKHFNKDFTKKAEFNDNSENTINNTNLFNKSFFHNSDFKYNTNEISNQLNLPEAEMRDLNPDYKYRYPQMTEKEFALSQWQTERGTPNALNQLLRSEANNESIEDVKKSDDIYQQGLQEIQTRMRNKREGLKSLVNDYNESSDVDRLFKQDDITTAEQDIKNTKKEIKKYIKQNPIRKYAVANKPRNNAVVIKPAVMKPTAIKPVESSGVEESKSNFNNDKGNEWARQSDEKNKQAEIQKAKDVRQTFKNVFNTVKNLNDNITEKTNNKKIAREALDDVLNNVDKQIEAKEETPEKSSEKEPDDDTFTVPESLKSTFQTALSILNDSSYKDKPGSYNMFSNKDDRIAFNTLNKALDKIQGKKLGSNDVRTLKTLREKFHINEKIVYNESPSKQSPSKKTPSKKTPSKK